MAPAHNAKLAHVVGECHEIVSVEGREREANNERSLEVEGFELRMELLQPTARWGAKTHAWFSKR